MRLLNASMEPITTGYDGTKYYITPYQELSISHDTGKWLMEREEFKGLVDITYDPTNTLDPKLYVVKKIIQGKEKYLEHQRKIVEDFIKLDTEYKNQNQFGTVLNCKEVRGVQKKIEATIKQIKDLGIKFNIDVETEEYEQRQSEMYDAIESIVAQAESDVEQVNKMKEFRAFQDNAMKEIMRDLPIN